MIKVTVFSYFGNSISYVMTYIERMMKLQELLNEKGFSLTLVLGYGDDVDGTSVILKEALEHNLDSILVDVSHGGPIFGSVVDLNRFQQLAYIGNKLWNAIPTNTDYVALIESDLEWEPETFLSLLDEQQTLSKGFTCPIIASPMVKTLDGRFYDVWAFRRNGVKFVGGKPYHRELREEDQYFEVDSVGSFFVTSYKDTKRLLFPASSVVVGFCKMARLDGFRIFVCPQLEVFHK